MSLSSKEYKQYVMFEKSYEDMLDDFTAKNQVGQIKPFNYLGSVLLSANRPEFAKFTGGTLGGVSLPGFSASPLDDYFINKYSDKWVSRQGASGYAVNDKGLYVPSLAQSPFIPIPQMYYDKWNHLWADIMTRTWDVLDNVSRFEYTEYGKVFGGTYEDTPVDAARSNVVSKTGTDTNIKTGNVTDNTSISTTGSDTNSGGVSRTYNNLTDTTQYDNTDTTKVSAYDSDTYEPSNEVTHATNGDGDTKITSGGYSDTDTTSVSSTSSGTNNTTTSYNNVSDAMTYASSDTSTMAGGELHRVHGNIGVTKTTELLDADIQFRIWRFYEMVMDDIQSFMFLKCY